MNHRYPSLIFYIGVSVISCAFMVRLYRNATPAQRRQKVVSGIGAVAIALFVVLPYVSQ